MPCSLTRTPDTLARRAHRLAILLLACVCVALSPLTAFAQGSEAAEPPADTPSEPDADEFDFDFGEDYDDEEGDASEDASPTRAKSSPPLGDKIYDATVLRPLRTVGLVVGTTLFIPAAIITAPGGRAQVEEAWDSFVVVTYEDAYDRPLGRL